MHAAAYKAETPLEIADGVPNVFSVSAGPKIKIWGQDEGMEKDADESENFQEEKKKKKHHERVFAQRVAYNLKLLKCLDR